MMNLESYRKLCQKQQTELRRIMSISDQFDQAIQMFLHQHAMLHSAKIAQPAIWSFEDALLNDMAEAQIRRIPHNCEHSIAWILWHIARIEDVTMNLLVAGTPQIFLSDDWLERLNSTIRHTGNAMDLENVAALSQTMDIEALRAYRLAVGQRTQEIVRQLQAEDLTRKIEPSRLQQVIDEGAVVEEASGVLEYWSKRNIAGLLLMPATRHNLIHLNEALNSTFA